MENISPQLRLILTVKFGLQNGMSVRQSIIFFLQQPSIGPFQTVLEAWFYAIEAHQTQFQPKKIDLLTETLLQTLEKGLKNQPIFEMLHQLEEEVLLRDEIYLQRQIAILPMKSLIPLLLLQVPALMIMIFVPMLRMLRF
jgi:hypothetical protein